MDRTRPLGSLRSVGRTAALHCRGRLGSPRDRADVGRGAAGAVVALLVLGVSHWHGQRVGDREPGQREAGDGTVQSSVGEWSSGHPEPVAGEGP